MIYQEKVCFDGENWYLLEWEDIDFIDFDNIEGVKDCNDIISLESIISTKYPNSNIKSTLIGKRKKK